MSWYQHLRPAERPDGPRKLRPSALALAEAALGRPAEIAVATFAEWLKLNKCV